MLEDRLTHRDVEVDVVVRQTVAGYPIVIGIECRAWKRRQGPGWVDEMMGKHQFLQTDRLVLVSESGFTETAYTKAGMCGVELLTLEEAVDADWEEVYGSLASIDIEGHWVFPRRVTVVVGAVFEPAAFTQGQLANSDLISEGGAEIGKISDLVSQVFAQAKPEFSETKELQCAVMPLRVRPEEGVRLRLPGGPELPLEEVQLVKEEWLQRGRFPARRRSFKELQLVLADSNTPFATTQLVIAGSPGAPSAAALLHRLRDAARGHCVWDVAIRVPGHEQPDGLEVLVPHDLSRVITPKGPPRDPTIKLRIDPQG